MKKYKRLKLVKYLSLFEKKLLFEWAEKIKASQDDLKEELKMMYEWEYKYHKVLQKKDIKNEKRMDNILKLIRIKLYPILNNISEKLIEVFDDWLEHHAILSPKTWAKKRIEDDINGGIDGLELIKNAKYEYERYGHNFQSAFFKSSVEMLKDFFSELIQERIDFEQEELDNLDEDDEDRKDYEERIKTFKDFNTSKISDIEEYIDFYMEGVDEFVNNIIEGNYNIQYYVDIEDLAEIFYKEGVFPVWYKYWKNEGIDKTRKRVENTNKNLNKVKAEKDLNKKIVYINSALNEAHQTGSMIDYVENQWGVGKRDLDFLSKSNVKNWNKEILKIIL